MALPALLLGLLLGAAPAAGEAPARTELFELRQPGVAGEAGSLGAARHVLRAVPGGWRAERELLLFGEETRLAHFETYGPGAAALVHREQRAGRGRTLRAAWAPGDDPRPEWVSFAGGDRRTGRLPSEPGLSGPLACVERARWRSLREREVLVDPLGATVEAVRTREVRAPLLGLELRRVDLLGEDGSSRGRLWFVGPELVGRSFAAGGPVAVRVGPERHAALVERFEELVRPGASAQAPAASREPAPRG